MENIQLLLENEAPFKELGRNKSPAMGGKPKKLFCATETESIKIITQICQRSSQNNDPYTKNIQCSFNY